MNCVRTLLENMVAFRVTFLKIGKPMAKFLQRIQLVTYRKCFSVFTTETSVT